MKRTNLLIVFLVAHLAVLFGVCAYVLRKIMANDVLPTEEEGDEAEEEEAI